MFFQLKPGGMAEVEIMNNSNKMDSFFIRVMRGWITNGQKIQHFAIGCKRNYMSDPGAMKTFSTHYHGVLTGVILPVARSTGREICSCTITQLPPILR